MQDKNLHIGLVIDSPSRDLRGMVLLAHQLQKRGARISLIPCYEQEYDVPLLMPDGIVVNHLRMTTAPTIRFFRSLGIQTYVLDTEGGLLSKEGGRSPYGWANFVRDNQ